jgi:hypothetical protein
MSFDNPDQQAQAFVDLGFNPETLEKVNVLRDKPPTYSSINSWKQMGTVERKSAWADYFKGLWQ